MNLSACAGRSPGGPDGGPDDVTEERARPWQHGRVTHAELARLGFWEWEPEGKPTRSDYCGLLREGNVTVLSGAGLSTESGIPDYRGPSGQARRAGQPMTYQAFTGSAGARQRYWARSHLGWRHVTGAAPNAGHLAVAALERAGLVPGSSRRTWTGCTRRRAPGGDRAARVAAPGGVPVVLVADGAGGA